MDNSANISIAVSDDIDLGNSTSLLNHNVSFNSTLELTAPTNESAGNGVSSSISNLSFSLSDTERLKLKQGKHNGNGSDKRSQRSALKELIRNMEKKHEASVYMETSVDTDESSTMEEDSERIINIDDTVDEAEATIAGPTIAKASKADLSIADASIAEVSIADASVADASVADTSIAVTSIADVSITDVSIVDASIADGSIAEATNEEPHQPAKEQTNIEIDAPIANYFVEELVELGRRCWPSTINSQHYTKGCYWSPDGTCLLVPVHKDGMHVMELPLDLYDASSVSPKRLLSQPQSAVHVPEGGTVYDCVWYPLMNSQRPETCFWLATRQHEPIHMWDAFDGRLRCSYSGYDEVDEVTPAISLGFSHDGQKIYAGYKRCIKIFDTNRPGRTYDEYAVKTAISCIAQTSEHTHTVTCGNWKGYIQHFDLRCAAKQGPLFTLGGHNAGITQLRYVNDNAGNYCLFSGARKCSKLLHWDMRNYKKPLREFQREVNTNQRIQFDLSTKQSWLVSGDTNGSLNIWNLELDDVFDKMELPLHADCCNGISFHPHLPIIASSSGQYHFVPDDDHECSVNQTLNSEKQLKTKSTIQYENAVLLLWCGESNDL